MVEQSLRKRMVPGSSPGIGSIFFKYIYGENNLMSLIVNLFGGPGSGKSTIASDVFSKLKWMGISCELVGEYAKDKVWENAHEILNDQIYVFGKQFHRIFRLNEKVDIIITDSPILLSIIYDKQKRKTFQQLVIEEYNKFNNINFFIKRVKPYSSIGRLQTEEEAKNKDNEIKNLLYSISNLECKEIYGDVSAVDIIMDEIKKYF